MPNISCKDFIEKPRWGKEYQYDKVQKIIYDESEFGTRLEEGILYHDEITYNTKTKDFVYEVDKEDFEDILILLYPYESDALDDRTINLDSTFKLIQEKELHTLLNLFSFRKNLDFVRVINLDYEYLKENSKQSKFLSANEKGLIINAIFNSKLSLKDIFY